MKHIKMRCDSFSLMGDLFVLPWKWMAMLLLVSTVESRAEFAVQTDVETKTICNATFGAATNDMVLIPPGPFEMGDACEEGFADERPVRTVTLSAFYMDRYEVSKAKWDAVYTWGIAHNYVFDNVGAGKAPNHPVHSVDWQNCLKWCNARSEMEGLRPAYYVGILPQNANPAHYPEKPPEPGVFRTGQVYGIDQAWVRWDAGYRLPTEAEWEKAARGGARGRRFPWGDSNEITHKRSNYSSVIPPTYDTNLTRGRYSAYAVGERPFTCPVDAFAPNAYGLYNMAGNVGELCWNWHHPKDYALDRCIDPKGYITCGYPFDSDEGQLQSWRGGSWYGSADACRVAYRGYIRPEIRSDYIGFRTILPAVEPASGGRNP